MVTITHPQQEDTRYVFFNSDGTYDIDDRASSDSWADYDPIY